MRWLDVELRRRVAVAFESLPGDRQPSPELLDVPEAAHRLSERRVAVVGHAGPAEVVHRHHAVRAAGTTGCATRTTPRPWTRRSEERRVGKECGAGRGVSH